MLGSFLMVCLQVPLADMGGGVAMFFKSLAKGQVLAGHVAFNCRGFEPVFRALGSCTSTVVGEPDPAGVLAREDTGPGGRANRIGRIGVVKKNSFSG